MLPLPSLGDLLACVHRGRPAVYGRKEAWQKAGRTDSTRELNAHYLVPQAPHHPLIL